MNTIHIGHKIQEVFEATEHSISWFAKKLNFDRQAKDAWWWRDACLLYFQQFSGMKLPLDCPAPKYKLEDLQKYNLPIDNYTRAPFDKLP